MTPRKIIVFDTETTGKYDFRSDPWDDHQPHLVQLAAAAFDGPQQMRASFCLIVKPNGWTISDEAAKIHGITTELAQAVGLPLLTVLELFERFCRDASVLVAHNVDFDTAILGTAYHRAACIPACPVDGRHRHYCTMRNGTPLTRLKGQYGDWKWPKLSELHKHLFGEEHGNQHDALGDVMATGRCYFAMLAKLQKVTDELEAGCKPSPQQI